MTSLLGNRPWVQPGITRVMSAMPFTVPSNADAAFNRVWEG